LAIFAAIRSGCRRRHEFDTGHYSVFTSPFRGSGSLVFGSLARTPSQECGRCLLTKFGLAQFFTTRLFWRFGEHWHLAVNIFDALSPHMVAASYTRPINTTRHAKAKPPVSSSNSLRRLCCVTRGLRGSAFDRRRYERAGGDRCDCYGQNSGAGASIRDRRVIVSSSVIGSSLRCLSSIRRVVMARPPIPGLTPSAPGARPGRDYRQ